jgi:hypothetical protein
MPIIRFATARDVFEAFPTARQDVDAEPSDLPSLRYLQSLAGGDLNRAVAFCAYLLPRREAIWWGCRCLKSLAPNLPAEEAALLKCAEDWVDVPEEDRRLAALESGMRSNKRWPSTWLSLAAGWSGGNILPGMQAIAPPPPQQTARAVRAAVLTAVSRLAPAERIAGLLGCIEDGIRIANEQVR